MRFGKIELRGQKFQQNARHSASFLAVSLTTSSVLIRSKADCCQVWSWEELWWGTWFLSRCNSAANLLRDSNIHSAFRQHVWWPLVWQTKSVWLAFLNVGKNLTMVTKSRSLRQSWLGVTALWLMKVFCVLTHYFSFTGLSCLFYKVETMV
jgi:hypothetical protein